MALVVVRWESLSRRLSSFCVAPEHCLQSGFFFSFVFLYLLPGFYLRVGHIHRMATRGVNTRVGRVLGSTEFLVHRVSSFIHYRQQFFLFRLALLSLSLFEGNSLTSRLSVGRHPDFLMLRQKNQGKHNRQVCLSSHLLRLACMASQLLGRVT